MCKYFAFCKRQTFQQKIFYYNAVICLVRNKDTTVYLSYQQQHGLTDYNYDLFTIVLMYFGMFIDSTTHNTFIGLPSVIFQNMSAKAICKYSLIRVTENSIMLQIKECLVKNIQKLLNNGLYVNTLKKSISLKMWSHFKVGSMLAQAKC